MTGTVKPSKCTISFPLPTIASINTTLSPGAKCQVRITLSLGWGSGFSRDHKKSVMVGEKEGGSELDPGTPTGSIFTLNFTPPPMDFNEQLLRCTLQGHHKDRSSHPPLLNISVALKAVYRGEPCLFFLPSLLLLSAAVLFWEIPGEIILEKRQEI